MRATLGGGGGGGDLLSLQHPAFNVYVMRVIAERLTGGEISAYGSQRALRGSGAGLRGRARIMPAASLAR